MSGSNSTNNPTSVTGSSNTQVVFNETAEVVSSTTSGETETKDPKDAQVIKAILSDLGISEYEPRMIAQLMEYVYRYVTDIAEDAKMISTHAKKKLIDVDDVRLAAQVYNEQGQVPSREVLLEVARSKNANPLPTPKSLTSGLRLPPDRFCLTGCNYRLKTNKKNFSSSSQHQSNINNRTTPIRPMQVSTLTPQGTNRPPAAIMTLNPSPSVVGSTNRIQITPSGSASGFTMTVNSQSVKRKADEMS